jgi:ATP-dependent helicase/nuclease subunit A
LLLEQRNDPIEALIMAPIKSAAQVHDPIYNYVMWCEMQRQEYEALRQLYVAVTRARKQLYCIGHVYKKGPSQNSLLARIWHVIAEQFVATETIKLIANEQPAPQLLQRLPNEYFNAAILPDNISINAFKQGAPSNDLQRILGTVMHRTLWQIAIDGIAAWDTARIQAQENIWVQQLRQLGMESHNITEAIQVLTTATNNTLNEKFAQIILSNQHSIAFAEWQLTVHNNGEPENIILDRAFIDQDQNLWVVDYKFIANDNDISNAATIYQQQLQRYVTAVRELYPEIRIIAGLYFPLQAQWCEINI